MLDTNFRVESAVILSQKNERIDSQLARLEKEREIRNLQRHERFDVVFLGYLFLLFSHFVFCTVFFLFVLEMLLKDWKLNKNER